MNFLLKLGVAALPIPFAIVALKKHTLELSKRSARGIVWWMTLNVMAICVYLVWGRISQYLLLALCNGSIFTAFYGVYVIAKRLSPNKKAISKKSQKTKVTQAPHPDEPLTAARMTALYKLAQQILDDEQVDLVEAKKLRAWFKRYPESSDDRRTKALLGLVEDVLADKELDDVEALDLFVALSDFCEAYEVAREKQGKGQLGKVQKPSFDHPALRSLKDIELGKEYYMEYVDSSGDVSERNIVLRSVKVNQQGQPTIGGYCLLRNSTRTFRADRVRSLCSVETGEVFV